MIRIRDASWDTAWQDDLLRVKVFAQDPRSVVLGDAWGDAQVLAVYDFEAYRMTELGADVPVLDFAEPIEIVLITDETDADLDVLSQQDGEWASAPRSEVALAELAEKDLSEKMRWVIASVGNLDRLCLIKNVVIPPWMSHNGE
jgi:hypothetical protein